MVMDSIQVRLGHGLVERIDGLVETGVYSSRSDVLRDAARRLVFDSMVGILDDKENSVDQVRKARVNLSDKDLDLDEINSLID
jgi:Arc/MetJ-type ribon-helix-helix transcriptional regulator